MSGVGAGDAMVGAIVVGLSRGWSVTKSVRFGIAAGAAIIDPRDRGLACSREDVERFFELVPAAADINAVHT